MVTIWGSVVVHSLDLKCQVVSRKSSQEKTPRIESPPFVKHLCMTSTLKYSSFEWLSGTSAVVVIFPADEDLRGRNVLDLHVSIDATIKVD